MTPVDSPSKRAGRPYHPPEDRSHFLASHYIGSAGACPERRRRVCRAIAARRRGDANCDGAIDSFDIDAFVLALAGGEAAWATQYACGYDCACDVNRDGVVNNFDIEPFVECLLAGNCPSGAQSPFRPAPAGSANFAGEILAGTPRRAARLAATLE